MLETSIEFQTTRQGASLFGKLQPEATGRLCETGPPIEKTSPITAHND